MNYRDWLQQVIYKIINPVVHGMIRIGITPNFITTTGLVLNIVAAALFVYAGVYKSGELAYVGWGGIWALGTACSYIAAGTAGAAISYGLGQGATMVAALWGVFIWKEFKGASKSTNLLIALMFILFILGLALIITSGGN